MTLADYQKDAESIKCYLCNQYFVGCVLRTENYDFGYEIEGFERKQALDTNCPHCKTRYTITEFDIPHTGGLKSRLEQNLAAIPIEEGMRLTCISVDEHEDKFYREKCPDYQPPETGRKYTIRTIEVRSHLLKPECYIRLRELTNSAFENMFGQMVEPKFSMDRFKVIL